MHVICRANAALTLLNGSNAAGDKVGAMCNVALEAEELSNERMQVDEVDVAVQGSKMGPSMGGQVPRC